MSISRKMSIQKEFFYTDQSDKRILHVIIQLDSIKIFYATPPTPMMSKAQSIPFL